MPNNHRNRDDEPDDNQLWPPEHDNAFATVPANTRFHHDHSQLDLTAPDTFIATIQPRHSSNYRIELPAGVQDHLNAEPDDTIRLTLEHPDSGDHATVQNDLTFKGYVRLPADLIDHASLGGYRAAIRAEVIDQSEDDDGGLFNLF